MMADGRDMSGLFAAVVKNVVSKNVEVSGLCNVLLTVFLRDHCRHVYSKITGYPGTLNLGIKICGL